jgi:hypothetical protein
MNRSLSVLLLAAVAGCVEEAPVTPFPRQVIPAVITASDRDLQPGETATLTVSLIRDSRGRVTTPASGDYLCAEVPSSFTLAPGQTKTFDSVWGGGVEFGAAGTSERVPPGEYYASGELRSEGYLAIAFPILIVVH